MKNQVRLLVAFSVKFDDVKQLPCQFVNLALLVSIDQHMKKL